MTVCAVTFSPGGPRAGHRLLAAIKPLVEDAADDARGGRLRVAELAGFVHLLSGEADVGDRRRSSVPGWNAATVPRLRCDFPTFLRRVVLVREPPLRLRFDLQRIGLGGPVRGPRSFRSTIAAPDLAT